MAYFPNGAAGEVLDNQCCECIHASDDVLCPVYYVQATYNYDQTDNDKLERCLTHLVNQQGICEMKLVMDKVNGKLHPQPEISQLETFDNDHAKGRI